MTTYATAGHRPQKIGTTPLKLRLFAQRKIQALWPRPTKIITGMAVGWDQAVAESCYDLGIPFIAAVPFEGQEERWPGPVQIVYRQLLGYATNVVYVSEPGFTVAKMHKRNQWMVDHCTGAFVLWDGLEDSGTFDFVRRAEQSGITRPQNWWSDFQEER